MSELDEKRRRDREQRADEMMEFLGAESVPDDYQPEPEYVPGTATRMMNERDAALDRAEIAEARVRELERELHKIKNQDNGY